MSQRFPRLQYLLSILKICLDIIENEYFKKYIEIIKI